MHLELVETLKCPNDHAPGVLVAAADEIEHRFVVRGLLGCPDCLAEYSVEQGITRFAAQRNSSEQIVEHETDRSEEAMRLAAQLGLSAGRTTFAVVGFDLALVNAMRAIVPARVLVFNARDVASFDARALASAALTAPLGIATIDDTFPLADRKLDGIAIANTAMHLLPHSVAALRPRGRLVAPLSAALPDGMRELVRDTKVWVAEREVVATAPISISRRAE